MAWANTRHCKPRPARTQTRTATQLILHSTQPRRNCTRSRPLPPQCPPMPARAKARSTQGKGIKRVVSSPPQEPPTKPSLPGRQKNGQHHLPGIPSGLHGFPVQRSMSRSMLRQAIGHLGKLLQQPLKREILAEVPAPSMSCSFAHLLAWHQDECIVCRTEEKSVPVPAPST